MVLRPDSSSEKPSLFEILDAYVRRPAGATRTIGTLLGWISGGLRCSGRVSQISSGVSNVLVSLVKL